MKKVFLVLMALVSVLGVLAGCGSDKQVVTDTSAEKKVVLKIGATPVPHAEILKIVKPMLAKEGIDLQIIEFTDYIKPNMALNDKEIDANFFQHIPYLEKFSKDRNLDLVSLESVHIEPMGVYSKTHKQIKNIADGTKVAIPNDPTNGGRALLILEKAGFFTLKDNAGLAAVPGDIVKNPHNVEVIEVEAAVLPRALEDVDYAVINSNFAIEANLNPMTDALFIEPSDSPYANIVAVRKGDEKSTDLQKLAKVLHSKEVKKFILEKYKGAVVPTF